jgi:hypothetical protein
MEQQAALTAEEILAMDDLPMEEVVVPEWKGRTVFVCGLTAAAKNAYQASLVDVQGKSRKLKLEHSTAKLLVRCLVNRERKLLFTESQILALGAKSAAALERLGKVASRLSGMDEGEQEQLLKNSEAAQSGDSPSASL